MFKTAKISFLFYHAREFTLINRVELVRPQDQQLQLTNWELFKSFFIYLLRLNFPLMLL